MMISVDQALEIIGAHPFKPGKESVPFLEAGGRILAEAIGADRDFPPFNRVAMDGIAIRYEDFKSGARLFDIEGSQYAGSPQLTLQGEVSCLEVMTGAMLPRNADTVIRYEDVSIGEGKAVINIEETKKGQNIHDQATDSARGDILLEAGLKISPNAIAILATVGKESVEVYTLPRVTVISTGDELVDVASTPLPYQIRQSNVYTIINALRGEGIASNAVHLRDDSSELLDSVKALLSENDVLIFSGGVSKGKKDYIPGILEELGVEEHFHRIAQKPGKPMWFGTQRNKTVFGLPGNPVSTYLCYCLYFKYWLRNSYSQTTELPRAILQQEVRFGKDIHYHLSVRYAFENGLLSAYPVEWSGSGDLRSLSELNGFLSLPSGKEVFKKGEAYKLII